MLVRWTFPLVPVAHGEGQRVGCSNVSSIPGGRGSSIHLTGTTFSAGVPKEMPQTTFRRHSDLAAECAPGLGLSTYCPQAAFIRSFMTSLGARTPSPSTGRGERDSGAITWIPSLGDVAAACHWWTEGPAGLSQSKAKTIPATPRPSHQGLHVDAPKGWD